MGILCLEGWQSSQREGTVCLVLLTVLTSFLVSSDLFSVCDPPSSFALMLFYLFGFPISMLGLLSSFARLAVLLVAVVAAPHRTRIKQLLAQILVWTEWWLEEHNTDLSLKFSIQALDKM